MTDYLVHGRHDTTVDVEVKTADGDVITGKLPVALIELTPVDGGSVINLQRKISTPEVLAAVDALFKPGNTVAMGDFTLVSAAAPVPETPSPTEA